SGDLQTIMAQNAWNREKLQTEIFPAIAKHLHGHPVTVANTEFSTELYSDPQRARGLFGALYSADSLATALDLGLETAVQFCLDHGDQADSSFFMGNDPARVTPIFLVQRLLARHWGGQELPVCTANLPTVHVQGDGTSVNMPLLGLAAARSHEGKIFVLAVNRTEDQSVSAQLHFGKADHRLVAHRILGSDGWNTTPEEVREEDDSLPPGAAVEFPPASVTILEAS
ncbi:MAG: hypothetical protein KGR26_14485, partial [Cyanobacteria bacterium REEB65]|nr:hypothetical protein [Cyanobacteria bacterium REEB65]